MSQYHKYFNLSLTDRIRNGYLKLRFRGLSSGSYILWGSRLLRFPENIKIGSGSIVKNYCAICACNPNSIIRIGSGCTIGDYSYIYASGSIEIGNNVLIAPFAYLVDSDHGIKPNELIRDQSLTIKSIVIDDDVWLGARVVILGGVRISKGAVIAAGSVVKDDVGEYEIWGGVPAKKIGERK